MIPHVQLISASEIKLDAFLGLVSKAIGYTLTKPADNATNPKQHERFLSALACFHDQNNTERPLREIVQNSASLTQHLHYSFVFAADADTISKSMERTRLKHTIATGLTGLQLAFVSGTLADWNSAFVECCNEVSTYPLRLVYNKAITELEKLGIQFPIRKKKHTDDTLLLEHKTI